MFKHIFITILVCAGFLYADFKQAEQPAKLLGNEFGYFMNPVWSPDGQWIAFTTANYNELWVLQPGKNDARQICSEPGAGFGFQWSADSQMLMARCAKVTDKGRLHAIKVFSINGDKEQTLQPYKSGLTSLPQWTPDGAHVMVFHRENLEIYQVSQKTPSLQRLPAKNSCLLKADQLICLESTSNRPIGLSALKDKRILNLNTSMDGSKVTFEVMGGPLCVMNSDGSGLLELGPGHRPRFSPDGKHIVYVVTKDDGHNITESDIYIIGSDGSSRTNITASKDIHETNPSWSPFGNAIVYDVDDTGEIWSLPIVQIN